MSPLKKLFVLSIITLLSACASNPAYVNGLTTQENWAVNTATPAPVTPWIVPTKKTSPTNQLKKIKAATFNMIETDVPATYKIQGAQTQQVVIDGSPQLLQDILVTVQQSDNKNPTKKNKAGVLRISLRPDLSREEKELLKNQIAGNTIYINAPKTLRTLFSQGSSDITIINTTTPLSITKLNAGPLRADNIPLNTLNLGTNTPADITNMTGMNSGSLSIKDNSNVFLSGLDLSLGSINKSGNGNLTINDVSSLVSSINNHDNGTISISSSGINTINEIKTYNHSQLYINNISGKNMTILEKGHSIVGLQGGTEKITANLRDDANLFARRLNAKDINITTKHNAHANIRTLDKTGTVCASASEKSTVYIFGQPEDIIRRQLDRGAVIRFADYPSQTKQALNNISPPKQQDTLSIIRRCAWD